MCRMAQNDPNPDHNPMQQEATLEQLAARYATNPRLSTRQSAAQQPPVGNEVVMREALGGGGQRREHISWRAGINMRQEGGAAHVQREQQWGQGGQAAHVQMGQQPGQRGLMRQDKGVAHVQRGQQLAPQGLMRRGGGAAHVRRGLQSGASNSMPERPLSPRLDLSNPPVHSQLDYLLRYGDTAPCQHLHLTTQ